MFVTPYKRLCAIDRLMESRSAVGKGSEALSTEELNFRVDSLSILVVYCGYCIVLETVAAGVFSALFSLSSI